MTKFSREKIILVKIGRREFVIENETCQGSIVRLLIFSIMINDLFTELEPGILFEMLLQFRGTQVSKNCWINLQGHEQDHRTQYVVKLYWEKRKEENKNFGWTATEKAKEFGVDLLRVGATESSGMLRVNFEYKLRGKSQKGKSFK